MDLPATQIFYDYENEPTQKIVQNAVNENEQVGILIVNSNSYPVYTGINKIGRHPECEISLNDQSVSKYHAEIEANKCTSYTWICDLKSSNKTKLNNVTLRPSRFYELQDNSVLEFGRIKAIYKNHKTEKDFVVPETPVQSKQKNPTTVIPGTPDSLLSNSSVLGEDISMIAATQSGLRKSDSSHSTTDQLLPKVLQNTAKNSARTLSLGSSSECKRTESHNKDNKTQDNEVLEDGNESGIQLFDQNKKNQALTSFLGPSRFSVETMQNNSTREQNDPSTSCESDDIFEAVTQRVNIDLDFRNRRESCSSSDETNIDEDAISNDMAPTQITHNTLESSTPIKKINLEDQLVKLKNIKCNQVNTNTIDDIDLLDTQVVSLPGSICSTKEIKTFEKQDVINQIDTLDTQIVNLPDSDYGVNNEQRKEKKNDISDIHLLDTQSVSIINTVDKNISSSVVKEGQQNSINDGSVEDVNYETAATQLIEDVEAISKEPNSKTKNSGDKTLRKSNGNDSLEQKLNDMFEEVNDDHVAEMSMISTQSLRNVLECSQRSSRVVDTTSHSVNDALSAQVQDGKSVDPNSQMPEMDSQSTEKYFSSFISKRKHNVLTDSQESIDSNITISARRKKKKESNITTLETDKNDSTLIKTSSEKSIKGNQNTTHSEKTVDHVEKDLLNSFEVSVHSSKEDAKCAVTSKSLDEEDDDILTRLPEVNISGTFSNPTTTLSTSLVQKKKSTGRSSNKRTNKKTDVSEVHESTSATTSISDSMEDIDYENLKKIAEALIPRKNNEVQSTKRKINTKKKINSGSDVSTQNNTTTLSNKPAPNTRGRKSKPNTTMESKSILSYVTRKSTRGNTESMNEINSNTIPTNSNKRQTRKQQMNTKASKTNSSNIKDSTSANICNSPVGKESQEVEMIMNKSVATISQNTRKRKKLNASSDNDSLHDSNISHVNLINSIQYKIPIVRVKRTKFNKNASLQSSIESTSTEDSLTGDSDTSIATNTTKSHSTRSKRTNVKEQKNENNTSILSKMSTRNTLNITKVNMENSEETAPVSPVPAIQRSVSRLSTSLNSSFSVKEKILFTGITDDEYIKVIKTLGGIKVEDPSKCTVLVTDKIRRTTKFLSALARAVPIVSINWLQESKRAGQFLDWENYMLKDPAMEAKYGFRLRKSLDKAREQKLLEGYTVLLTPNIQSPPTSELKVMIMSCGGKALLRSPPKLSEKTIILSHQDDLENARKLLLKVPKNVTIQSTEFLLTGILKQELDFVRHKLI